VIDLSIVIVSYNTREDLIRCLASLTDAPPALSHEIIVVDNGSIDGSAPAARDFTGVRVIETGLNRGFAAANNLGIQASLGEHLLLLNSDTVVPRGAIDHLRRALDRHPEAAVVGPRLVDVNGRAELSFGPMLSPLNEWRQRRLFLGNTRGEAWAVRRVAEMTTREQWPDWVSAACLLVRRADAEAVGLLDERYFMYTEDVDFCAAIRARGRKVLFTPDAEIVHLRGRSALGNPDAIRRAYRQSHHAFYRKHHPWIAPLVGLYHWLARS
jgi:GT2 family glycosyltransferase